MQYDRSKVVTLLYLRSHGVYLNLIFVNMSGSMSSVDKWDRLYNSIMILCWTQMSTAAYLIYKCYVMHGSTEGCLARSFGLHVCHTCAGPRVQPSANAKPCKA
jgi:hypothetical protein